MTAPTVSDEDFIEIFQRWGTAGAAKQIGVAERNVRRRRRTLERIHGRPINAPGEARSDYPQRVQIDIENGTVLVGSDVHLWPNYVSTAFRAFLHFTKKMKPDAVVLNGDVLDLPQASRHPRIGWEHQPTVNAETENAKEQLGLIEKAAKNAKLAWTLGNHDARFETRLAQVAPEYANMHGVHLKDHFPYWHPCWAVWINDEVVIKHRFKGGIHATHNNTMWAGKTIVTGHLHSQKITPFTDYNGTRYGVDCGTLADPEGPQFMNYTEDNPLNWRSGFVVLTFRDGLLLPPELVTRFGEGKVTFRGEVIEV